MAVQGIINIFAAIVTVALVSVIVTSPNTATIITATTSGFADALGAAKA